MLTREEFLSILFDDLALPELLKKELCEVVENKFKRGGIVRQGNPGSLSLLRTFRASLGRRVAAEGAAQEEVLQLESQAEAAREALDAELAQRLALEIQQARDRASLVPFIDPVDLRYRSLVEVAVPHTAAVMFCLMDVSGSMDEERKDLAKRFFTLLYLFLTRKYEKVELVFIRHTDHAEEVDEDTFFHAPQTGGTLVLSALQKMDEIIKARYPASQYNIFGAQASDGDSFGADPLYSRKFLQEQILTQARYFVYAETNAWSADSSGLWRAYSTIAAQNFNLAAIDTRADVYPALVKLFSKEVTN
jgi:uncharacterized sporulation protein YeaH/YhbH (DUF444 family)